MHEKSQGVVQINILL